MHHRLLVALVATLLLLGLGTAPAQAGKVRSLKPWAKDNRYLVKADTDGRTKPQLEPRAKVDHLRKGQWVRIACQVTGQAAYGSTLWVRVGRYFVPDQMLKTYTDGRLQGAPTCKTPKPDKPKKKKSKKKKGSGGGKLSTPQGGWASYQQVYDLGKRFKGWAYRELTAEMRKRFSRYFPFKGCGKTIKVGKRCVLEAPGPNGPVRVMKINQYGFELKSLKGHPEGANRTITFRWMRSCSRMTDWQFCDYTYLQVNAWGPASKLSLLGPFNAETVAKHYWTKYAENIRKRYPKCPPGKGWVQDKYRACLPII